MTTANEINFNMNLSWLGDVMVKASVDGALRRIVNVRVYKGSRNVTRKLCNAMDIMVMNQAKRRLRSREALEAMFANFDGLSQ